MANSRRESRRKPRHKMDEKDEEAQKRRDRIVLIVMLVAGVLIVGGMIALSMFLSGGP